MNMNDLNQQNLFFCFFPENFSIVKIKILLFCLIKYYSIDKTMYIEAMKLLLWSISNAEQYPSVDYNEVIVDNCCMQLVSKPEQFDVMVVYYNSD